MNSSESSTIFPAGELGTAPVDSSAQQWSGHEHVAAPIQLEAQKLLDQAGSPDLAKQAIDAVAEAQALNSPRDELARHAGFPSWSALEASSVPLSGADGNCWFVTPLADERWIAWNIQSFQFTQQFAALEDLYRYLAQSE
jgi:hypothetical protein